MSHSCIGTLHPHTIFILISHSDPTYFQFSTKHDVSWRHNSRVFPFNSRAIWNERGRIENEWWHGGGSHQQWMTSLVISGGAQPPPDDVYYAPFNKFQNLGSWGAMVCPLFARGNLLNGCQLVYFRRGRQFTPANPQAFVPGGSSFYRRVQFCFPGKKGCCCCPCVRIFTIFVSGFSQGRFLTIFLILLNRSTLWRFFIVGMENIFEMEKKTRTLIGWARFCDMVQTMRMRIFSYFKDVIKVKQGIYFLLRPAWVP